MGPTPLAWKERLPVLTDEGVSLRQLEIEDTRALMAQLCTPSVCEFVAPPPQTEDAFVQFILATHSGRVQGRVACFGIVPAGQAWPVGIFQFFKADTSESTVYRRETGDRAH